MIEFYTFATCHNFLYYNNFHYKNQLVFDIEVIYVVYRNYNTAYTHIKFYLHLWYTKTSGFLYTNFPSLPQKAGLKPDENSLLYLILAIFGLFIVDMAIMQSAANKIWEK